MRRVSTSERVTRVARLGALLGALAGGVALGELANRSLEGSGGEVWRAGETRYHRWRGGDLAYSVTGSGPPVMLVHGIYAGASSFEFARNVRELSENFTVYTPDLLGCGRSEKPSRIYQPGDVTDQVETLAREVVGEPVHLVASSLSAALAMPAAVRSPRLFGKLVLVCPTGYRSMDRTSGRLGDALYAAFRTPVVGDSLYHALVSHRGIRFYLEKIAYYDASRINEEDIEGYYAAGHGRGAKYLPAAFASGKLNLDVRGYWPRVPNRSMIFWGKEARDPAPVGLVEAFVGQNSHSEYRIFEDSALLPHIERPEAFDREVKQFLTS